MPTRLLDLLMRNPRNTERGRRLKEAVSGAVPFIVDNVMAYIVSDCASTLNWTDFPNIAPPFERWWMEYKGWNKVRGEVQVGAVFYSASLPADRDRILEEAATNGDPKFLEHVRGFLDKPSAAEARWLINVMMWERRSYEDRVLTDKHPIVMTGRFQFLIKADGSRATDEIATEMFDLREGEDGHKEALGAIGRMSPFLLAMSFLHCKNVKQVDTLAPRQERRRLAREGKPPGTTYKTLVIEPMQKVLHTEGRRSSGLSIAGAMHICRGHFKHFDERPLFGKHRGMFFWHDQVRNTQSNRAVAKRYDVHAGAAAGAPLSAIVPEALSGE